jgi:hypothetical protein
METAVLHVDLHCQDFMDRVPVAQTALHVRLLVVPYYWHPASEPEPGSPPDPHEHSTLEPAFELAEAFDADAVSDAAGGAAVDLHPASAWDRLMQTRLGGALPRNVMGHLQVTADVPWLELHVSHSDIVVREPDASPSVLVVIDPAKLIVGYTTPTSTRFWFQLHGSPRAGFTVVGELAATGESPKRLTLAFTPGLLQTAVAAVDGLRPATTYAIQLIGEQAATSTRVVLASGSVRTLATASTRWDLAFTSCHLPTTLPSLASWIRRAGTPSADLMLMIGDQIYADGMPHGDTDYDGWFERYVRRYNQLWAYQPLRDVLRRTPTCMMLDDHEVKDDWGVTSIDDIGRDRWRAALQTYRRFQDPLNPPGHAAPTVWDFGWRSGPLAFYMLDERSHRGFDDAAPVLGSEQLARFRAWAGSADTRLADVVIVASGVPPAFLPIDRLLDTLTAGATAGGAAAGAIVGGIFGGPAGALIGALVGSAGAGIATDTYVESLREPDFHDQWTYERNQPELAQLLDVLFDLANDITGGVAGPRPRAVIVVSGDIHIGGCYLIRSQRRDQGHDHRRNPLIFQFIASPSSTEVPSSGILRDLMAPAGHEVDLRRATFLADDPDVDSDNPLDVTHFVLDTTGARHYAAEMLGSLWDYNFGTLGIERTGPRVYRFTVAVAGSLQSLTTLFELDLDAPVVRPRDLIGERLTAAGTPVLLRVHEQGSSYGPASDPLDAEVVVQIDRAPGQSFGLRLRRDATFAAHRGMFDRLRDAFNHNMPVTVEYDRTGPRNGTIVRVY